MNGRAGWFLVGYAAGIVMMLAVMVATKLSVTWLPVTLPAVFLVMMCASLLAGWAARGERQAETNE